MVGLLFFLLSLVTIIILIIGVIRPSIFSRVLKDATRKKIAIIFGLATIILFSLSMLTTDTSQTEVAGESISATPTSASVNSPTPTKKISTPTPTSSKKNTPTPTKKPTPSPTKKPTSTPIPTKKPTPTQKQVQQNIAPPQTNTGGYACNCSKTCSQMSSCTEAQYQLNTCGCSARDGDKDGIACDSNCQ